MCILFIAYRVFSNSPLLILDNRDENLSRPTDPLHDWGNGIVGGKDQLKSGTWMAVNKNTGRFAVLTNRRRPFQRKQKQETDKPKQAKLSRGEIVLNILNSESPLEQCLSEFNFCKKQYGGFNIVTGDLNGWENNQEKLYYFNNYQEPFIIKLNPFNVYGLSNTFLHSTWPKVKLGVSLLQNMKDTDVENFENLFKLMTNNYKLPDDQLIDTGLKNKETESCLSSIFVDFHQENYGTRTTSILQLFANNPSYLFFSERTYPSPESTNIYSDVTIEIPINSK